MTIDDACIAAMRLSLERDATHRLHGQCIDVGELLWRTDGHRVAAACGVSALGENVVSDILLIPTEAGR